MKKSRVQTVMQTKMSYALLGETNFSLVLEYADSGTLGKYLSNNATTFKWKDQIKFANDIASAILCLHENEIIHGDLVSIQICYFASITFAY
jgi:serine/threonine protein kinase